MKDWVAWREAFDDPTSALSARLKLVQAQLAGAIDHVPGGLVRVLSASWRRPARSLSMLT